MKMNKIKTKLRQNEQNKKVKKIKTNITKENK